MAYPNLCLFLVFDRENVDAFPYCKIHRIHKEIEKGKYRHRIKMKSVEVLRNRNICNKEGVHKDNTGLNTMRKIILN